MTNTASQFNDITLIIIPGGINLTWQWFNKTLANLMAKVSFMTNLHQQAVNSI